MTDAKTPTPRYPDQDHVIKVCKIGQDAACCRYLTMSPGGWSCEKHGEMKAHLDARADNCEGLGSR